MEACLSFDIDMVFKTAIGGLNVELELFDLVCKDCYREHRDKLLKMNFYHLISREMDKSAAKRKEKDPELYKFF